jgi:hypothetical protein
MIPPPPGVPDADGGGGLAIATGSAALTGVRLLNNRAGPPGGAVFKAEGAVVTMTRGCIVGNSRTSVYSNGGPVLDARYNWWNSPGGPWGAGPGWGDSVSANVDYSDFLTEPVSCPTLPVDLSVLYFPLINKK